MTKQIQSENLQRCSFCHKSKDVVDQLIASPKDLPRAYICDECVFVCVSIIAEKNFDNLGATSHRPSI